ncbi:MAG: protein translocase subunit SecD [Candidatus Dormibacteraceae bacterium]
MRLVLSWPVRVIVVALLLFTIFVDGAGYWYRIIHHDPLTGNVSGMPPSFFGQQLFIHKGLDLSGGSDLLFKMSDFPNGMSKTEAQQLTIGVIQTRVDQLGVTSPSITAVGDDEIDVQLAGVNAAQAAAQIGNTARLVTATWVADKSITKGPFPGYKPQIVTDLPSKDLQSATAALNSSGSGWVVNLQFNQQGAAVFGRISTAANNAYVRAPSNPPATAFVSEWLDLTQQDVDNWNQVADTVSGQYPQAKGGKLVVNPVVQQPTTNGQVQISGGNIKDSASAKNLANLLNSGALPVTLTPISATDVGAQLGQESVNQSLLAGALGLIIVVIFMLALYRLPGLLASLALCCYAGLLLMVFKVLGVAITLGGLTGFVLTVGMAVDANVLIFERLKEELRAGRTMSAAVERAVSRAWPAIRDSNFSTLITAIILYALNTGDVQGFALTLALGVLASMLSSIIITHNLLSIVLNLGWARTNSILGVPHGRPVSD